MRPLPIVWFERLYFCSMGLILVQTVLFWQRVNIHRDLILVATVGVLVLLIAMVELVARNRSKAARIFLIILWVLGLMEIPPAVEHPNLLIFLPPILLFLQGYALILTYSSAGRSWFSRKQ